MNTYSERISEIKETLTNNTDLHKLTIVTSKCVELQFEIKLELSNHEIPSLREETESQKLEKMQSQLHKEEITLLLRKIVDKIGDGMGRKYFQNI